MVEIKVELKRNQELVEVLKYDASIVNTEGFSEYSKLIQKFVDGLEIGFDFNVNPPTLKIYAKDISLTIYDGNYLVKPVNSLCVTEKECIENMENVSFINVSNMVIPNIIN